MAYANYRANHAGVRELLRSQPIAEIVEAAAEKIADRARTLAPVRSGDYRDSIRVVSDVHASRVASHVGPHVSYGLVVEARSHVMRRSLG